MRNEKKSRGPLVEAAEARALKWVTKLGKTDRGGEGGDTCKAVTKGEGHVARD